MHWSPIEQLSASIVVECLACGVLRPVVDRQGFVEAGECLSCGDVGWARPRDLGHVERASLRRDRLGRRRSSRGPVAGSAEL